MNFRKRKCAKAVVVIIGIIVIPSGTLLAALRDEHGLHGALLPTRGKRDGGEPDQAGSIVAKRVQAPRIQIDLVGYYPAAAHNVVESSVAVPLVELNSTLCMASKEPATPNASNEVAGPVSAKAGTNCIPVPTKDEPGPLFPHSFLEAGRRHVNPLLETTRRYTENASVEPPLANRRTPLTCQADNTPNETGEGAPGGSASPTPSGGDYQDMNEEPPIPKPAYPNPVYPEPMLSGTQAAPSMDPQSIADQVPLPTNPALPTTFSESDLAQVESPMFLSAAINQFNERPIMLTGNWSIKPHLSIGSFYDGNIFLQSNGAQSDFIVRAAPGVTMRLGNDESMFYMMADYTVGFDLYTQHTGESTVDQNGTAQLQWRMPKTTIGLNLGLSQSTGQDVDVGNRVRQELYYAGVTSHYAYGEKTSWDVNADYTRSDFNGLISSSQIEGQVYFNYQYSEKTQIGVGGSVGDLIVPGALAQYFEDADVRATYRATGKLTLIGDAGMEMREFGSGIGSSFTPVFSLEVAWAMREGTQLDLTARRSIYASAILDDQNYTATSLGVTVRQRITDYVDVSLGAGYVNSAYSATAPGVNATREDNYFYVRPAVAWRALSWLSIGIYYEYDQDLTSGGVANNFVRDSGGVDAAILF